MKRFAGLVLQVVAILAYTGSSLGDGGEGGEVHQECSVTLDEGERMDKKIFKMGRKCLDPTGDDWSSLLYFKTKEEHQDFFKNYCGNQSQIRECLADVARESQACQNETRHQTFQVLRELIETTLEAGCVQDGVILADIVMIYKRNITIPTSYIYFHTCLSMHLEKVSHSLSLQVSDFSRNYIFYRDIKLAKECFNNISGGDQPIKTDMVNLLNAITERYKCFDPQDDSVVLCKNLDPKQDVSNEVCPIKSKDEQTRPLYNILLTRLPIFLTVIEVSEYEGVSHFENREQSGEFFKLLCEKKDTLQSWLKDAVEVGSSCLDNGHNVMFQTVATFMENLYDQLCAGEGRYLADVVSKAFSDVANSTDNNALRECKDIAQPPTGRIEGNFTSERTLKYYQKLKVFKGCLVDKLKGDDVAVSSAELILNGVINNMKCPDPEETSLVLCETIANTNTD